MLFEDHEGSRGSKEQGIPNILYIPISLQLFYQVIGKILKTEVLLFQKGEVILICCHV